MRKTALILLALAFSAAANAEKPVTIGLVADIQYARNAPDKKGRHYSIGPQRLSEAVDSFNAVKGLAFVADLGDMTDRDFNDYADLKQVKDRLDAPCYNVFGNHDFRPAATAEEFAQAAAVKGLGKRSWYSIVKDGVRFIFLNCSDVATHSCPVESEAGKAAARWLQDLTDMGRESSEKYNGGIGLEQFNWLDKQLSIADRKGEYALVLCHMPLMPLESKESLWNNLDVVHMIENHPSTKAVICGHKHSGAYDERLGIHYVNLLGMVEGENNRYCTLTVDKDSATITIDGYGDEPDRTLSCRK